MDYVVETPKSFDQASADLEIAVKNNGFGVLHIHNLGETLRSKGMDFKENCRVFDVCNPQQASKVLQTDMRLNMALPCRISVYTENNQTRIGFLKPTKMVSALTSDLTIQIIAHEVEDIILKIVNETK